MVYFELNVMNKIKHIKSNRKGFTLIELLIATAITGIVAGAIFTAFQSQQKSYLIQDQVTEMQQNIRAAMYIMVREIRMAGYDPYGDSGAGITAAAEKTFTFTLVADDDDYDNDNDTITDEIGELKTIQYNLYDAYSDGDNDIGRQVGSSSSSKRAVAENIEEIEFFYTLADGSSTTAPANPSEIRSVQITILARVGHQDPKFTNTKTYYTTLLGVDWGPYNDGFRRRLLSTTVKCRNMGL
jgi:type IV pilus assembly protein PilW